MSNYLDLTLSLVNFMLSAAQFARYRVKLMRREDAKTIDCLPMDLIHSFVYHLSRVHEPRE